MESKYGCPEASANRDTMPYVLLFVMWTFLFLKDSLLAYEIIDQNGAP